MNPIGDFPIFVLALLHSSNIVAAAMQQLYHASTASEEWQRESERTGIAWAKSARRGYDYEFNPIPLAQEIPGRHQSYEQFWAEIVADRDTWWSRWKKEYLTP